MAAHRSGPSASKNAARVLRSRPGAAHTSRPLSWSTTIAMYRWPSCRRSHRSRSSSARPAGPGPRHHRRPLGPRSPRPCAMRSAAAAPTWTWTCGSPARRRCRRRPGCARHRDGPRAHARRPHRDRGRTPAARRPPRTLGTCPGPAHASDACPRPGHTQDSASGTARTGRDSSRVVAHVRPASPHPGRTPPARRPSSRPRAGQAIPWKRARRSPITGYGPSDSPKLMGDGVPLAQPVNEHPRRRPESHF